MPTASTTETGLGILGGIRSARPHTGASNVPASSQAGRARTRSRLPGRLAFGVSALVTLVGLFILAYGITHAIVDGPGHPAPDTNHVSTIPTPRG